MTAGTESDVNESTGRAPRASLRVLLATAVVASLVGALVVFLVFRATAGASVPDDAGVDAGFARDMQTHHRQAVEMSLIVRDRTDDPEIRSLAYDILTSQQQQAGQMYGWLVQWGLPQTGPDAPMSWVGGDHGAHAEPGTMPGMATDAQLDELRAAEGVEAERVFLRLMITHHEGGVEMAEAAIGAAQTDEVRLLAEAIDKSQANEITLMEDMLAERT